MALQWLVLSRERRSELSSLSSSDEAHTILALVSGFSEQLIVIHLSWNEKELESYPVLQFTGLKNKKKGYLYAGDARENFRVPDTLDTNAPQIKK